MDHGTQHEATPRSIAGQSIDELGGPLSILTRQRADHQRLDRLMARARRTADTGGTPHSRTLRAIARLVFTHAFAEEAVLFPATRRALPEGDPLTQRIELDHQKVNELTTRLDCSTSADPEHTALLREVFDVLDHDVRVEEDELLARLQQLLTPGQLRALGLQWELVRRIAPTRPHPVVSRRPPGQTLSALPLTTVDRLRDRLQRVDELTRGGLRPGLTPLDRALAAAAGAIERTPLLRRGETPDTSIDDR